MRQNRTNINFAPIIMNGCNQPYFISADIKHRQLAHFIRRWKN